MLIGLTGRKQSGKSTIAAILRDYGFIEDSFAAPLRDFTARILAMTPAELETAKERPVDWLGGITPRHMMQTIGTEWGRDTICPDLWVKSLERRVMPLLAAGLAVVISDLRFDNEAHAIRALGGRVVRVERAGLPADTHRSENGVSRDLVDLVVKNRAGLTELRWQVVAMIKPAI